MKRVFFKIEKEPLYAQGYKYAAYLDDGTPLYMGEETSLKLQTRIRANFPNEDVEFMFLPSQKLFCGKCQKTTKHQIIDKNDTHITYQCTICKSTLDRPKDG